MNRHQPHHWFWHFPYQFCSITIFTRMPHKMTFWQLGAGFLEVSLVDCKMYLFTFGSSIEWKEKQKLFSKTLEMQIHCLSQCKTYLLSTTAGVKVHFPIFHLTAPSFQQITLLFFIWKWAQKQEYNAKFGDKWPLHPNGKIRENSFWKYVFPTFAFSCLGR